MGTLSEPVQVAGLASNFSPIPRMAPLPLGGDMAGGYEKTPLVPPWTSDPLEAVVCGVALANRCGSGAGRSAPFMNALPSRRPCFVLATVGEPVLQRKGVNVGYFGSIR